MSGLLLGLFMVGFAYLFGVRWKNKRVGRLAGAMVATSLGLFFLTEFYALPIFLIGFFPWSVFLPKVIYSTIKGGWLRLKRDRPKVYVVLGSPFLLPAAALWVASDIEESLKETSAPSWIIRGLEALIVIWTVGLCWLKWPSAPAGRDHVDFLAVSLGLGISIFVGVWGMRRTTPILQGIFAAQLLLLCALIEYGFIF